MILFLSIYVIIALIVETFFSLPKETSLLLNMIDNAICMVFLFDFVKRFIAAENKMNFMRWGWIDLLANIPTVDVLRGGRALRLIRLIRVLRAYRSTKHLFDHLLRNKARGTFGSIAMVAVLMVIFSSIAILQVESHSNSNIKTAEDALWWSYVAITTVGYGDKFPITSEGRIIAAALMTVGVGLFGTFTGVLASWFLEENHLENNSTSK